MTVGARFERLQLRTTDVAAARAFYAELLGPDPLGRRDDVDRLDIALLPEAARARGAVPHWLGHLGVDDVEATARVSCAAPCASGRRPRRRRRRPAAVAILRDPGGAIVAPGAARRSVLAADADPARGRRPPPAHARRGRALEDYAALFGWSVTGRLDLGPLGVFHQFAWQPGGPTVGAMVDVAGRVGVHTHWLFHFPIAALDPALERVRAAGGLVIGPVALPDGGRVAVCDDPQGAAFALRETPGPSRAADLL
ncbi:MAG: VOC family protein [Myxococcota bacterium]